MCFGAAKGRARALVEDGYMKARNSVRADKTAAYLYTVTPKGIVRKMFIAFVLLVGRLRSKR